MPEKMLSGFARGDLLAMVVVGIVLAILSSNFLRIFANRRGAVVCMANSRQMMRSFALYAQDHGGLLPPNEDAPRQGHTWCSAWANILPDATNQLALADPRVNLLARYSASEKIWKCPEDPGTVVAGGVRCHFAAENHPVICGSKSPTPEAQVSYQDWFKLQAGDELCSTFGAVWRIRLCRSAT